MSSRRLNRASVPPLVAVVMATFAVAVTVAPPASAITAPSVTAVSPKLGTTAGGTRVTVSGARFVGVTSVKFGTTAGRSLKVLSAYKLQITTPAHAAGLANIRVTTKTGTSPIVAADQFRFVGKPTVSKISPALGPSTGGTRITITGTGFYSVSAVTIGGKAGTSRTVVSPTSLKVTTPAGTSGTANVVVKTAFGTSVAKTFTYRPSWWPGTLIDRPMGGFQFVSCAGRICVAVDRYDNVLIYSGSGWSEPKKLVTTGYITALSCGSPTRCVVGDNRGYVVVWNGFEWSTPRNVTADYGGWITAISCSSGSCVAVDASGYYSVLAGTTWSAPQMALTDTYLNFTSLSCTSATFCMGLVTWSGESTNGTDAYEFHGVNTGWSFTAHLTSGWTLSDLSCSTLANSEPYCVAIDATYRYFTWDDDADWSPPAEITLTQPGAWAVSVACTPLENCWLADSSGVAYAWNGATWDAGTPVVASYPFDIACGTSGHCAIVDADNQATLYVPGTGWTTPTRLMIAHGGIQAISCPTKTFCVAIDGGYAFRWNGVRWSDPINLVAPNGTLTSVSCVSPTFCAATSGSGQAIIFDGTSWVTTQLSEGLAKVSCATSGACVAVGWHSAFVWNGSVWSDAVAVITDDFAPGLRDVACVHLVGTTRCVAVDPVGHIWSASVPGGVWTPESPVPVDGGDEVAGLSCSSGGTCIAITVQGFAWMDAGGGWGNAVSLVQTGYDLMTVSCAAGNLCVVAAWSGRVYTTSGDGNWSNKQVAQGSAGLLSASCASSTFCVAGDNEGRVYRFV